MNLPATSSAPVDLGPGSAAPWWRVRPSFRRRLLWLVVCIISTVILYYQWENWRSARELANAWQRLIVRVGTDDPLQLAPPAPPDAQNFFALPVFKQWQVDPVTTDSPFRTETYRFPEGALMPKAFTRPESADQRNRKRFDLEAWARARVAAGQPLPAGEPIATVLDRELGDGNGLLPQLAAGLDRPFSQMKPNHREALVQAGDEPWKASQTWAYNLIGTMDDLAVHLRAAATNGNITKARDVVNVMLRWCEGIEQNGTVQDCMTGAFMSEIVFAALQDALAFPVWDDRTLSRLQMEVHKIDDLMQLERALCGDALVMAKAASYVRQLQAQGRLQEMLNASALNGGRGSPGAHRVDDPGWDDPASPMHGLYRRFMDHCPAGIHDANAAFLIDQYLRVLGPKGSAHVWMPADDRGDEALRLQKSAAKSWNPRRLWGGFPAPFLGGVWGDAAMILFHRRCVVVACGLERYRLAHGAYPASLDLLTKELAGLSVNDPARPDRLPSYRPENGRYRLWSAGPDGKDDGGLSIENDWLWPEP